MKILKYTFLSLLMVITLASCNNWINTQDALVNPNGGPDAPDNILLTQAMLALIQSQEGSNARYANMFTQHFRGLARQHGGYDGYIMNSQNFTWSNEYQVAIHQLNFVIEKATAAANRPQAGIAKLVKAWILGTLTSLYGDIPFSQIDQFETIKEPIFDNQMTVVYPGVQAMLTEAIADLGAAGGIDGSVLSTDNGTVISETATWIELAHTLKARFYLHTKDYANAVTEAGRGISVATNNFFAPHTEGERGLDVNMWYDFLEVQRAGDYGVNTSDKKSFLGEMLKVGGAKNNAKTNESARYANIFTVNDDGNATGINTSGTLFGADSPFPMGTYEENQLILAEAYIQQGNKASALTALNNVRVELDKKYPNPARDSIPTAPSFYQPYVDADFATNADLATEILRERYVSLTGQLEVFADLRRTNNAIGLTPTAGTQLPGRFLYPNAEAQSNTNTPSGGTLFDILAVFK